MPSKLSGNLPTTASEQSVCGEIGIGRVLLAGRLVDGSGIPLDAMRILGHYAVVLLTAGAGRCQFRGRAPMACREGDLLVLFPDIPHAYGPEPGGRWDEYYLVFDGPVFDLWRSQGLLSPDRPVLRPTNTRSAKTAMGRMVADALAHGGDGSLDLVCRLQQFLAAAVRGADPRGEVPPAWITRAMRALASPPVTPQDAARAAGLSYESFRKKFQAATGLSPAAWRDRHAMRTARKFIYEEGLTNKEIAARLGFCDEFHFSKRFRAITGQTPRAVRASLRGSHESPAKRGSRQF
jgi:AraC-like DNA-binding protein